MVSVVLTLAKRGLMALLTVFITTIVVFAAVEVLPQDPARAALGIDSTAAQRAAFRHQYGLDQPALERYFHWLGGLLHGRFGNSVISHQPIAQDLWPRLQNTATLAVIAIAISLVIGIPLAVRGAQKPGGFFDTAANFASVSASAVPEFVLGMVLSYIFASELGWLPVLSDGVDSGQLTGLVLPSVTLGLGAVSYVFRFARVGVIEISQAPHIRAAILRGTSQRRITYRHILPLATATVVNVVALNAIYLLGGVIVVENLFAYPGLGTLLLSGVSDNDLPTIEAVAVVTATLLVTINLAADMVVVLLNPRLRSGGR